MTATVVSKEHLSNVTAFFIQVARGSGEFNFISVRHKNETIFLKDDNVTVEMQSKTQDQKKTAHQYKRQFCQ